MTVVGLHPEELFDKLLGGEITPSERERLRAHLQGCDLCRFEYSARLDFQDEARAFGASSPPALVPLRAPAPPIVAPRRRRSRLLVWGLAAAALITASGAVASVATGQAPWQSMSLLFSRANTGEPRAARLSSRLTKVEPPAQRAMQPAELAKRSGEPEALPGPALELPSVKASAVAIPVGVAARAKVARSAEPVVPDTAAVPGVAVQELPVKEPAAKEPAAAKEPISASKLFAEANQARRAGDVGKASGLYYLLQDQFPGSAEAELSRVTLSLLLLDSGDAQAALRGFERYLAGGTRGLEAEALVGRARALARLGRRDLEATAWQEVQRKYPRSIYGRQASERLLALGQP